jgi:hypothetical protein
MVCVTVTCLLSGCVASCSGSVPLFIVSVTGCGYSQVPFTHNLKEEGDRLGHRVSTYRSWDHLRCQCPYAISTLKAPAHILCAEAFNGPTWTTPHPTANLKSLTQAN